MNVNADDLIKFARTLEGELLSTLSGTSTFTVEVKEKGMDYVPTSTGKARKQSYNYIKRICDRFSETQSFRRTDYAFTAHGSYALALIDRYVNSADPYNGMDQNIVGLVNALNAFDGIYTVSSCGGHQNNTPYQLPLGKWEVMFMLEAARVNSPSVQAWLTLELLAFGFSKCFDAGDGKVQITVFSPDPFLNGPGDSITFTLEGNDVDPDALADWLVDFKRHFVG